MLAIDPDVYADSICSANNQDLEEDCTLAGRLLLARSGSIAISYAPFDYVNQSARVVICGLTPGRQQAVAALLAFRSSLAAGSNLRDASERAKLTASFAGPMRANLARMLDHVGLNGWLQLPSCGALFSTRTDLVHYTSALRYPVFVGRSNYSGRPDILRTPLLRSFVEGPLAHEVRALPNAAWVPIGRPASAALLHLSSMGLVARERVLDGLPHASGANAERIAYFCGQKSRAALSRMTCPDELDAARLWLTDRIAGLH